MATVNLTATNICGGRDKMAAILPTYSVIFFYGNFAILMLISLKFVPTSRGPINNKPALAIERQIGL